MIEAVLLENAPTSDIRFAKKGASRATVTLLITKMVLISMRETLLLKWTGNEFLAESIFGFTIKRSGVYCHSWAKFTNWEVQGYLWLNLLPKHWVPKNCHWCIDTGVDSEHTIRTCIQKEAQNWIEPSIFA